MLSGLSAEARHHAMNALTFPLPAAEPALPSAASDGMALITRLAHVETWIFDLDNTLYSHEARVWPQVDERITLYLSELFGIDGLSARALQKYYYHRYGTTLKGLMQEQGISATEFLDFVHQIDLSDLDPDPKLGEAISRLPGRKLILTNGSRGHAENVSGKLGIRSQFEDIFDIADAGFVPKPEQLAYDIFLKRHHVEPKRAVMFEDIAKNLLVPHALGMRTVLVLPRTPDPYREAFEQIAAVEAHVDFMTRDLTGFLTGIETAGAPAA
jgi:putative hydrolase of the HAD superfamily